MDMIEFQALRNRRTKVSFWKDFINALPLNSPTRVNVPEGKTVKNTGGTLQSAARMLGKSVQVVNFNNELWVAYIGPYIKKEKVVE